MIVRTCLCVLVVVNGCAHVCAMFVFSCFDCVSVWEATGLKNCSISGHLAVVSALSVSMPVLEDFVSFVRVIASFTQTAQQWRLSGGSPTPTFFLLPSFVFQTSSHHC